MLRLAAPGQGDGEPEDADEDEVAGEEFEVAFADFRDFRREAGAERGLPEGGLADDAVKDIEDQEGGTDEAGAGVISESGEEMQHHAVVAEAGDDGDEEDAARDPGFGEIHPEDAGQEILDFSDEGGDEPEGEHAADRAVVPGMRRGPEHDGSGGGQQECLQKLDGAAFDGDGRAVRQPRGQQNGYGTGANQGGAHECARPGGIPRRLGDGVGHRGEVWELRGGWQGFKGHG